MNPHKTQYCDVQLRESFLGFRGNDMVPISKHSQIRLLAVKFLSDRRKSELRREI